MKPTYEATATLKHDIETALRQAGLPALVTFDPSAASAAVLDGSPAIILPPPRVSLDWPASVYEWEIPIISAPVGDQIAAWKTLDALLVALIGLPNCALDEAQPITWEGTQLSQAPAYKVTITRTYQ